MYSNKVTHGFQVPKPPESLKWRLSSICRIRIINGLDHFFIRAFYDEQYFYSLAAVAVSCYTGFCCGLILYVQPVGVMTC